MVVNTSIGSLVAQEAAITKSMDRSLERLSLKWTNTAADDAAGVAIASRLETQSRAMAQAIRNAADGRLYQHHRRRACRNHQCSAAPSRTTAQSANDTNVAPTEPTFRPKHRSLWPNWTAATQTLGMAAPSLMAVLPPNSCKLVAVWPKPPPSATTARTSAIGNSGWLKPQYDYRQCHQQERLDRQRLSWIGNRGVAANASVEDVAATVNANTGSTGVKAAAITKAKLRDLGAAEVSFTLTGDAAATISATMTSVSTLAPCGMRSMTRPA